MVAVPVAVVKLSIKIGVAFAGVATVTMMEARAARAEIRKLGWSVIERPFVNLENRERLNLGGSPRVETGGKPLANLT